MTTRGVVYYGTNKEVYVDQAIVSAMSVKEKSPGVQTALFTNIEDYAKGKGGEYFDHIIYLEPQVPNFPELLFIDKLNIIADSPFDHTLYLDSDTYVYCDLNDVFALLGRFQVVITHAHHRRIRDLAARGMIEDHEGRKINRIGETLPSAFAPVQGGFVMLDSTDKAVQNWVQTLIQRYKDSNFYDDQVAIRNTLWEDKSLSIYCLPEEYNFKGYEIFEQWKKNGFLTAVPGIMHYTAHKTMSKKLFYKGVPMSVIEKIKPFADAFPAHNNRLKALGRAVKKAIGKG